MATRRQRYFFPQCEVIKIVDGDTVDLRIRIDVGFKVEAFTVQRIRLARINAPEDEGDTKAEGDAATEFLWDLIPPRIEDEETGQMIHLGATVAIETFKVRTRETDSFGRYIADVWEDPRMIGSNWTINDHMVGSKLAEYKDFPGFPGVPRASSAYVMQDAQRSILRARFGIETSETDRLS